MVSSSLGCRELSEKKGEEGCKRKGKEGDGKRRKKRRKESLVNFCSRVLAKLLIISVV
jgi:hypothetical protein